MTDDPVATAAARPRVAWQRLAEPGTCCAPRHAGQGIPAAWLLVVVNFGPDENLFQATCGDCLALIAGDLGVDVEEAAVPGTVRV